MAVKCYLNVSNIAFLLLIVKYILDTQELHITYIDAYTCTHSENTKPYLCELKHYVY